MSDRAEAERRTARRVATGVVGLFVLLWGARLILAVSTGSLTDQGSWVLDLVFVIAALAFSGVFVVVGWAIVTRQPRNTIGWLLLAIPLIGILGLFWGDYASEALVVHPGSLPFGRTAAWFDRWTIVAMLAIFIPLFLLFPDGRIPSRRWRPVLWLTIAAPTIAIVTFALTPGRLTGAFAHLTTVTVTNPLGVEALRRPLEILTVVAGFATLLTAFFAGAAIVVRVRGASGEVRQQVKWLAFVGVAFLVEFIVGVPLTALTQDNGAAGSVWFVALFLTLVIGIPLACAVAILKYRLYDLDVVIRKTVVFTLVAGTLTALYLAVLGLATVGKVSRIAVGTVLLAVTFNPVRRAARSIADRVVYGRRASAYEILTEFSGRVGETYATQDVLPRMALILAEGTGASSARVLLKVGGHLLEVARSGDMAAQEHLVPVVHQGEELGALAVAMPANDPLDPPRERLVRDLASQAGLVLRNVRLIEDLRASRQRLVAAQDEERRKIERNIHDGAQQQLVALSVKLRLAGQLTDRDPDRAKEMLAQLQEDAGDTLENLRDLARGIYPPLLADKGLAAALESQARKTTVPTTVEAGGVGRLAHDVEAAVYFSCLEALQNVAKYADASRVIVRLAQDDGHLTFEVTDDGRGFDPTATGYGTGLQGMADRLDAIDGRLEVVSSPGAGTTVRARIAVAREEGI